MDLELRKAEKTNSNRVAIVALERDGKLLLGLRGDTQKWAFPGGHLLSNEVPSEGALRELHEETGLSPNGGEITTVGDEFNPDGKHIHLFHAKCEEGNPTAANDPDAEFKDFAWMSPEELSALDLHIPSEKCIVHKLLLSEPIEKSESPTWLSADGLIIPVAGTPARELFNKHLLDAVIDSYAGGDSSRIKKNKVNLKDISVEQLPTSKDRVDCYKQMLSSGEELPPIIVRKDDSGGLFLIDGANRFKALAESGAEKIWVYEIVDSLTKAESFKSKDGITIPAHGTAARREWNAKYLTQLATVFARGDMTKLKKVKIPVATSGTNMPVNKDRLALYTKMAKQDRLPPVVVRRMGNSFHLIDGNHRQAAAQKAGLTHLDAYEIVDNVKKSEQLAPHKILSGNSFGLMSGEAPRFPSSVPHGHENLVNHLKGMGLDFEETEGQYDTPEKSIIIHKPTREQMTHLGKMFGQESVVFSPGHPDNSELIYTHGSNEGKHHESVGHVIHAKQPENNFTKLPGSGFLQIHFNFDKLHSPKPDMAKSEEMMEQVIEGLSAPKASKWTPDHLHEDVHPIAHLETDFGNKVLGSLPSGAFGALAIRPDDAQAEYNKSKILKERFPGLEDKGDLISAMRSNHKLYNLIASARFARLKARHGSPEKAAFAWRYGDGLASGASDSQVWADPYVQQYAQIMGNLAKSDFFNKIKEQNKKISDRIAQLASSTIGSAWQSKHGFNVVVGKDPHNRNQWRATVIQDGEPDNHYVGKTHHEALGIARSLGVDLNETPKSSLLIKSEELAKEAPPGMEDVVLALKDKYGHDKAGYEKAFKIAWSIYNKKKEKRLAKAEPKPPPDWLPADLHENWAKMSSDPGYEDFLQSVENLPDGSAVRKAVTTAARTYGWPSLGDLQNKKSNIKIPDELVEDVFNEQKRYPTSWKRALVEHPNLDSNQLNKILDKASPASRRDAMRHPNITAEHITKALNDDDFEVRARAIEHPNATAEHITKALNDDDFEVRARAIEHPNATAEHITKALDDKDEDVQSYAIEHPNATAEHITKVLDGDYNPDVKFRAINHPNVNSEHVAMALDDGDSLVRKVAIKHPSVTPAQITAALKDEDRDVRRQAIQHPNATAEHISLALADKDRAVRNAAIRHPGATPEHITKALDDSDPGVQEGAVSHNNANEANLHHALNSENEDIRQLAAENPKATPEHITRALKDEAPRVRYSAISHSNATPEHITTALTDSDITVRRKALAHHNVNEEHLKTANNDKNEGVRQAAAEHFLNTDALFPEKVNTVFGTNKLRKLRDFIEQQGGSINKKQIPNFNPVLGHLLDGKGNLTSKKIQEHIDSQPAQAFNISHSEWDGDQRHSEEPSKVFQLNMTKDHIKKMKDAGVFDTFNKLHNISFSSGHPVRKQTVGWVRYTGGPEGIQVDEVQSDLGSQLGKQARLQAQAQGQNPDEAEAEVNHQLPPEHLKTIQNILFAGKHPSEVLHESFRQHLRDKGLANAPLHVHDVQTKMPLAQQESKKEAPAHMKFGYSQFPEKMGMEPNVYGELPTQSNARLKGAKQWSDVVRKAEEDTSFDFGANDPSNDPLHQKALKSIARMHPDKQKMAHDWIAFTRGQTPQRPEIHPDLERHLARFGIVDPAGYSYGEDGRSLIKPTAGQRVALDAKGNRVKQPDGLRQHRGLDMDYFMPYQKSEEAPFIVDAAKHGMPGHLKHDDVQQMIHGLDLSGPKDHKTQGPGINQHSSYWMQGPKGKVYVKEDTPSSLHSDVQAESAYHNIAKDFFKLGNYMPKVGSFVHPTTGKHYAAVEGVEGDHFKADSDDHEFELHQIHRNGDLHKMAFMNMVLQNPDRHRYNYIMPKDGGLKLIDHGLSFSWANEPDLPHYVKAAHKLPNYYKKEGSHAFQANPDVDWSDPKNLGPAVHPKAAEWALKLNPTELKHQIQAHGIGEDMANESANRLKALQVFLTQHPKASITEAYREPQHMTSEGFGTESLKTGK